MLTRQVKSMSRCRMVSNAALLLVTVLMVSTTVEAGVESTRQHNSHQRAKLLRGRERELRKSDKKSSKDNVFVPVPQPVPPGPDSLPPPPPKKKARKKSKNSKARTFVPTPIVYVPAASIAVEFQSTTDTAILEVENAVNARYVEILGAQQQRRRRKLSRNDYHRNLQESTAGCEVETSCVGGPTVFPCETGIVQSPTCNANAAVDEVATVLTDTPGSVPGFEALEVSTTTIEPTSSPTASPSSTPTFSPTPSPTEDPTDQPTKSPTDQPTMSPTDAPTSPPTHQPTEFPTYKPTMSPTQQPSTNDVSVLTTDDDVATSSPTDSPSFSASPSGTASSTPTPE